MAVYRVPTMRRGWTSLGGGELPTFETLHLGKD
jgi:hypothetical protein